jgi:hypothetical protein
VPPHRPIGALDDERQSGHYACVPQVCRRGAKAMADNEMSDTEMSVQCSSCGERYIEGTTLCVECMGTDLEPIVRDVRLRLEGWYLSKPRPFDVESIAANAGLGGYNERVVAHFDPPVESHAPNDLLPVMAADSLALVAWARRPHVHVYDRTGKYRAMAPWRLREGQFDRRARTLQLMDCTGVALSVQCGAQPPRRPYQFDAAQVWRGRLEDAYGFWEIRRARKPMRRDDGRARLSARVGWNMYRSIECLLGPTGALLGWFTDRRDQRPGSELISPEKERLAVVSSGNDALMPKPFWRRRDGDLACIRIIDFATDAPAEIRALTIALQLRRHIHMPLSSD